MRSVVETAQTSKVLKYFPLPPLKVWNALLVVMSKSYPAIIISLSAPKLSVYSEEIPEAAGIRSSRFWG
jgi:hypothetical protein